MKKTAELLTLKIVGLKNLIFFSQSISRPIAKKTILKLLVAFGLLAWFLHKHDMEKIVDSMGMLSLPVLFILILLSFSAVFVNALKWHIILPELNIISLFKLNLIGKFYSMILPGQLLGDAAKAYLTGKGRKTAEPIVASVVVDKITGLVGLLILGIAGMLFSVKILPGVITWSILIAAIFMILCLFCLEINIIYRLVFKSLNRIKVHFHKSAKIINRVELVFHAWHGYSKKLSLLFYSILFGILHQLQNIILVMLIAYNLDITISFFDWCWIFAVVSVVLVLPISIGGIGVREGALVGTMATMGVIPEKSLALSFLLLGLTVLSAIAGGILFNLRTNKKSF